MKKETFNKILENRRFRFIAWLLVIIFLEMLRLMAFLRSKQVKAILVDDSLMNVIPYWFSYIHISMTIYIILIIIFELNWNKIKIFLKNNIKIT